MELIILLMEIKRIKNKEKEKIRKTIKNRL